MSALSAPLLFPALLGDGFDALPSRVRALHLWFGRHEACLLPPAEHENRFLY